MAAAGGAPAGAGTASAAEPVLRKDCSRALKIPFLPATAPAAPQPDNIRLPLYDYQRRSVARMQTIEAYTQGDNFRGAFNTFLDYAPRGGVIADGTGLGKTAAMIGLILSEPERLDLGPNLIVTPSHLYGQWQAEIVKFAGTSLKVFAGLEEFRSYCAANPYPGTRTVLLVDVSEVLKCRFVYYEFRKAWGERPDGTKYRLPNDEMERCREAARFINGAYKGNIYRSCIHMPEKPFRRVVFDEVHDLVECGLDGAASSAQNNFMQLTRKSQNVWLMSATPFPKGDRSVYGLHQLLGFHRLKLRCELTSELPSDHPFEVIKRKLYVKNPESVRQRAYAGISVVETMEEVQFSVPAEAAFYHSQAQALAASFPQDNDLYSVIREDLRRLCCHPAASKQLREAFVLAGGHLNRHGNHDRMPLESLDTLSTRIIRGREEQLQRLRKEMASSKVQVQLSDNTVRICEEIDRRRLALHTTQLGRDSGGSVTTAAPAQAPGDSAERRQPFDFTEDDLKALTESGVLGMRTFGDPSSIRGAGPVARYIDCNLRDDGARRTLLASARRFITATLGKMRQMERDIREVASALEYYGSLFQSLQGSEEGPECCVCLEPAVILAFPKCGHVTCKPCMDRWLSEAGNCPTCRVRLDARSITIIHAKQRPGPDPTAVRDLARRFGSKAAALICHLQRMEAKLDGSKAIVFSMWDDMLHIVSEALTEVGIVNRFCEGSREAREDAIRQFRESPLCNVIMLSTKLSASGSNLQCANNVILLDPPGHNPADGGAMEQQAIARSVRLGQTRPVTVTRFAIKDSIEGGLYQQNARARARTTSAALQDDLYRVEAMPAVATEAAALTAVGGGARAPAGATTTLAGSVGARRPTALCHGEVASARLGLGAVGRQVAAQGAWRTSGGDASEREAATRGSPEAVLEQPARERELGSKSEKRAAPLAEPSTTANEHQGPPPKRARGKEHDIAQLATMGFAEPLAGRALIACEYNFDRALEMLLQGNVPPTADELETIVID